MAENNNGGQQTAERMHEKKFWKRMLEENFQWILIIVSVFLGLRKPLEAGEKGPDGGEPPRWVYNLFSFIFTIDEQKYVELLDDFSTDVDQQEIFFKFKDDVVAEGYDEDYLRLMMVNVHQDWLNRKDAKTTDIPKSAIIFIEQIVAKNGGYTAQKRIAEEKKFLKKVGGLKQAYLWHKSHKLETIVGLFLIPYAFVLFVLWLLGA